MRGFLLVPPMRLGRSAGAAPQGSWRARHAAREAWGRAIFFRAAIACSAFATRFAWPILLALSARRRPSQIWRGLGTKPSIAKPSSSATPTGRSCSMPSPSCRRFPVFARTVDEMRQAFARSRAWMAHEGTHSLHLTASATSERRSKAPTQRSGEAHSGDSLVSSACL